MTKQEKVDDSSNSVEHKEPSLDGQGQQYQGKVCILCIDGGGMRGIIPGRILEYLERTLQEKSGNPDARIAEYFDVAAGTSVGGIIATMLFTAKEDGQPIFTAEETWRLVAEKGRNIFRIPRAHRAWSKLRGMTTPRYSCKSLESVLKHHLVRDNRPLTLRDTLKPILIPCYDVQNARPMLFSRASALTDDKWNFNLWEICRATSSVPSFFKPTQMMSVNGKTSIVGIDGGLVMNNPTAAAIAHVLHNKAEFPGVYRVGDMLILSLGTGRFDQKYKYSKVRRWGAFQWAKPIMKIVLDGISEMVDHNVSMSFGEQSDQYLRVQVSGLPSGALTAMDDGSKGNVNRLLKLADEVMGKPCMEHLPFMDKNPINENSSNKNRLDCFADLLVQEHNARNLYQSSVVNLKPSPGHLPLFSEAQTSASSSSPKKKSGWAYNLEPPFVKFMSTCNCKAKNL